jgi:anti-sigma B factor antagonist
VTLEVESDSRKENGLTSGLANASDLQVAMEERNEDAVVRLRGRLSIDSSPAFRDQLLAVLRRVSVKNVVVDLTEVSYIDASGIATLVEALKITRSRRKSLCLNGLQGRVLHLFEVTGLLDLFGTNGCRSASTLLKVP